MCKANQRHQSWFRLVFHFKILFLIQDSDVMWSWCAGFLGSWVLAPRGKADLDIQGDGIFQLELWEKKRILILKKGNHRERGKGKKDTQDEQTKNKKKNHTFAFYTTSAVQTAGPRWRWQPNTSEAEGWRIHLVGIKKQRDPWNAPDPPQVRLRSWGRGVSWGSHCVLEPVFQCPHLCPSCTHPNPLPPNQ